MPTDDNAFILEQLLYDCELNKPIGKFLENVKIIASQRDAIFSAIEFPEDHPIEKAVRAIFAATLMHLNLGKLRLYPIFLTFTSCYLLLLTTKESR